MIADCAAITSPRSRWRRAATTRSTISTVMSSTRIDVRTSLVNACVSNQPRTPLSATSSTTSVRSTGVTAIVVSASAPGMA
jgi:hypothetical protein